MKKYTIPVIVIAVILLLCGFGCGQYNGMVSADQQVENAWADVQNQYQRRLDLIPNLVETVKGYSAHEAETFQNVTNARAGLSGAYNSADSMQRAANPGDPASLQRYGNAQGDLMRAFNVYVNAVREAYPDLKANDQFLNLQDELAGTENRVAEYRRKYNEAVKNYNLKVKRFPGNIFAGWFGFEPKSPFEAEEQAQSAPKVQF